MRLLRAGESQVGELERLPQKVLDAMPVIEAALHAMQARIKELERELHERSEDSQENKGS